MSMQSNSSRDVAATEQAAGSDEPVLPGDVDALLDALRDTAARASGESGVFSAIARTPRPEVVETSGRGGDEAATVTETRYDRVFAGIPVRNQVLDGVRGIASEAVVFGRRE